MNRTVTLKSTLQRLGVDVRRHRPSAWRRAALIDRFGIRTVVDVGANTGQYGRAVRAAGFGGHLISFEPLPDAFEELAWTAADDPYWGCVPTAASDRDGTATLHRAADSPSSSLLTMAAAHLEAAPHTATVGTTEVSLCRLDECDDVLAAPDPMLLKLDVQGHELTALRGATALLPRVALVEIELSVRELYVGAPSMRDTFNALAERGFELLSLEEGFHDPRDGQVLQYDGFFARPEGAGH